MSKETNREEKVKNLRILEIDKMIRSGSFPNAKKLCEHFEVSRATIMRDLDFLRDRYEAPLEYDYNQKGFYYSDKSFAIQNVMLNESEVFSIFAIQPLLEQYRNTPLEGSVKSIFQKLVDFMPNEVSVDTVLLGDKISFIPDPKPEIKKEVFNAVFKCIREKKTLQFEYKGNKDKALNARFADPLHIVCRQGDWYMMAWCHNHREVRMFNLARIGTCQVTTASFEPPEGFSPEKFFDPSFGIWSGEKEIMNVELLFAPILHNFVMERSFHPSEKKEPREDGYVYVTFQTNQMTQLINWVLQFGKSVQVLNPPELVEEIRKTTVDLYKMYKK